MKIEPSMLSDNLEDYPSANIKLESGEVVEYTSRLASECFIHEEDIPKVYKLYARKGLLISSRLKVIVYDEYHTELPLLQFHRLLTTPGFREFLPFTDYMIKTIGRIPQYVGL
jgi:hypothetical protein